MYTTNQSRSDKMKLNDIKNLKSINSNSTNTSNVNLYNKDSLHMPDFLASKIVDEILNNKINI